MASYPPQRYARSGGKLYQFKLGEFSRYNFMAANFSANYNTS